jgi:hypothetical protein
MTGRGPEPLSRARALGLLYYPGNYVSRHYFNLTKTGFPTWGRWPGARVTPGHVINDHQVISIEPRPAGY